MAEKLEGWGATDAPLDGYASEKELDTRQLIAMKNRKNRKSGGFQVMGLSKPVFQGVMRRGYKVPTPIQRKTIPLILEGKDVVAMARTGSGKTACFLIPLFEKLQTHSAKTGARALILSPTRELALQTLKFTKELGRFTGLRAAVILGGDSMDGQFAALHENPDIIIGTPGRLAHVCVEMSLKLQSVEYVVFDEADRLFELGFTEQLTDILKRLSEVRQTLLFSATLPKMLIEFTKAGLTNPVLIRLDVENVLSENLKMAFFKCNTEDKLALLFHVLQHIISYKQQTLIFVATRHHVDYLHMALDLADIPNTFCYSGLDPSARKINVAKFHTKKVRCLIVTDVAARGIDIPLLDNVINFNFPGKPKMFIHRVGRVARAGRSGIAYSFIAPDEAAYLMDLHLFLSNPLKLAPYPPDKNKKIEWNMYGSVPQNILDNENDQIQKMHNASYELMKTKQVIAGAYKQYVKSRPPPSSESVKRMKENELVCTIGYHPLLIHENVDMEERRLEMLHALKNLQPKGTVFELVKTHKDGDINAANTMQLKREYDDRRIEAFHKNIQMQQAAKEEKDANKEENKQVKIEQSTEEEVKHTFSSIVGQRKMDYSQNFKRKKNKRSSSLENTTNKKRKDKENQDFRDKEFYIPYSRDEYAEKGYSLGTSYLKDVEQATMDLIQDDDVGMRKAKSLHKWDSKRKKFVGTQDQKRRIKTECGVWIRASYKTNRYQKWIERCKGEGSDENVDEEDAGKAKNKGKKRWKKLQVISRKSYGKTHPLLKGKEPKGHRPPRRELRTEDEVIKETNRKENERKKHSEGRIKKTKQSKKRRRKNKQ